MFRPHDGVEQLGLNERKQNHEKIQTTGLLKLDFQDQIVIIKLFCHAKLNFNTVDFSKKVQVGKDQAKAQ